MILLWVMSPFLTMAQAVPTANTLLPLSLRAYTKSKQHAGPAFALAAAGAFQTIQQLGIQAENRFMLKDMSNLGMALLLPKRYGSLGFGGHFSGGGIFSSFSTGTSMGIRLDQPLGIGICMKLTGFKWATQPVQWGIQAGAGMLYCITPATALGFQLEEWLPVGGAKENRRTTYREIITGIGTAASSKIYLGAEIRKRTGEATEIGGLLEWQLDQTIGIRTGINTANNIMVVGITKQMGDNVWGLDIGNHPQLGFSIGLTMNHASGK